MNLLNQFISHKSTKKIFTNKIIFLIYLLNPIHPLKRLQNDISLLNLVNIRYFTKNSLHVNTFQKEIIITKNTICSL